MNQCRSLGTLGYLFACFFCELTTTNGAELTLVSSKNLASLRIGETATISAVLSELSAGTALDSLFATVTYDETFIEASGLAAGPIVPAPLFDPLDFAGDTGDGLVDAAFSTFSTSPVHHITNNGVFFEFQIAALSQGNGALTVDVALGSQFNPADPTSPIDVDVVAGPPIDVSVIPEPASWLLGSLTASALFMTARRMRVPC
jgi:hypothetical protein